MHQQIAAPAGRREPPPASLALGGVTCWFGTTIAVDSVDLVVAPGEHVVLTGSNGSGKSTLLRAILGFHRQTAGSIAVDGEAALTKADWQRRRRRAAWMPQRQATGNFPLLVRELIASSGYVDEGRIAAERLGIWPYAERPVHTLSGGQLQRAFLARALGALAGEAGLLLADEPTAALDFDGQELVAELIAGLRATVLVASHDRAVMARCHRVVEMAGGRLREVCA